MKKIMWAVLLGLVMATQANAQVQELNVNTWEDEISNVAAQTTADFSETFAGAWGTFDLNLNVMSTAVMTLSGAGNDLDQDNNSFTFTTSLSNETLNPGFTLEDLTITEIKFNAAGANGDHGELNGPWGTQIWEDGNAEQGIAGHDTANVRFNLLTRNGGAPFTSFVSAYDNGSYRINDVRATVTVVSAVPEPSSIAILTAGVVGLISRRRRS